MSDEPVLLTAHHDGVRTLTLNRPHKKNAINAQLWLALADAFRAVGSDRGVRALVVAGAAGDFGPAQTFRHPATHIPPTRCAISPTSRCCFTSCRCRRSRR
jgi:Enoyl-CoA hydratase/isomerase